MHVSLSGAQTVCRCRRIMYGCLRSITWSVCVFIMFIIRPVIIIIIIIIIIIVEFSQLAAGVFVMWRLESCHIRVVYVLTANAKFRRWTKGVPTLTVSAKLDKLSASNPASSQESYSNNRWTHTMVSPCTPTDMNSDQTSCENHK